MNKNVKKNVLGKGLGALIPQKVSASLTNFEEAQSSGQIKEIEISKIKPNKLQPRVIFEKEKLEELSESIKEHGVIQPIRLKPEGDGYRIIFGERRFRAVKMLGKKTIPAIISDADEEKSHIISLIENIQRENLNAIEEAEAYNRLINEFKLTQEEVALRVGKSRPAVANLLRLLKLAPEIQNFLIEKKLSMGHIRSLLAVDNIERQLSLAKRAVDESMTVRELEQVIYGTVEEDKKEQPVKKSSKKNDVSPIDDPHMLHLIEQLQHKFMSKVKWNGNMDRGSIQLEFHSGTDLHRILEILGVAG
jgi:ParB family transcriptional regulator, chromosome partitioning protein